MAMKAVAAEIARRCRKEREWRSTEAMAGKVWAWASRADLRLRKKAWNEEEEEEWWSMIDLVSDDGDGVLEGGGKRRDREGASSSWTVTVGEEINQFSVN